MKKSSIKSLKSLSTPKTKSLKAISGAKSKKKTMANGNKVCFRLVTEPSEQKIVRLKAEALKKLYATKICAYCKQTVPSRQFKHHVKTYHPYRCAKCGLLFSDKEEKIGHRREKHSSQQYHCIICNKIFDEKWHYGHHIKSLVHRNNREIYRRAINIMKSCIGLELVPASKDLMILEDGHSDSTQKSLVPVEQRVNLFCSTEDVTLSYHEPEVQKLLNELSDVKSVMLNLVKSNSDFSFGQFTSSGQSDFFDCQIARQVTQNFISDTVYSSEDAQFNDLTLCSENASLMSQNALAKENYSSSSSSTLSFDDPNFRDCYTNTSQQNSTGMSFMNPNFRACITNTSQQDSTGMSFENPNFRAACTNTSQQESTGMSFENPHFRAAHTNISQQGSTGMSIDDTNLRDCLTTSQQNSTGILFDDPHFRASLINNGQQDNASHSFNDTSFRTCHTRNSKLENDTLSFCDPGLRSCPTKIVQPYIDNTTVVSKTNSSPTTNDMLTDAFRLLEEEGYFENDQITSITSDIDVSEMVNNKEFTNLTRTPLVMEQKSYLPGVPIEHPNLTRIQVEQNPKMPEISVEQCSNLRGIPQEQNPSIPGIPVEQCYNLSTIPMQQSQIDIINENTESTENYSLLELSSGIPNNAQMNITTADFSEQNQRHFNFDSFSSSVGQNVENFNVQCKNRQNSNVQFQDDPKFNIQCQTMKWSDNAQCRIGQNFDKVQCEFGQNFNVPCQIEQNLNVPFQNEEEFKAQCQSNNEDKQRNVQAEYFAISQEIAQDEGMEF